MTPPHARFASRVAIVVGDVGRTVDRFTVVTVQSACADAGMTQPRSFPWDRFMRQLQRAGIIYYAGERWEPRVGKGGGEVKPLYTTQQKHKKSACFRFNQSQLEPL